MAVVQGDSHLLLELPVAGLMSMMTMESCEGLQRDKPALQRPRLDINGPR